MITNLLTALVLSLGLVPASYLSAAEARPTVAASLSERIQPWPENPRYWQYKGRPVMLLGGSKTDCIFLLDNLEAHLDAVRESGANYIRNTMAQRRQPKPHKRLPDGRYDLDQWNEDYWRRFENMLKWTAEREIVVQIEIWDRFDYADRNWEISPWNPKNNINYDYAGSGFAPAYRYEDLFSDEHPFFHTVKGTSRYMHCYELIRKHQEAFVAQMLSYSLRFGHVLYCINNETSSEAGWGKFWIDFSKARAATSGVVVWATDMFDDTYLGIDARHTTVIFNDPEHYMFAEISQVNSRNFDEKHWDTLQWLLRRINRHPRPSNHTKIYGSGYHTFGTGGPEDGIERFWRNLLGGSASARFHRPDSGNGLNDLAQSSIRAARLLEERIRFWEVEPHMELLSERAPNEAYLAAKPPEKYVLYFPNGGSVRLDLSRAAGTFEITWISVSMGRVVQSSQGGRYQLMDKSLEGGRTVTLSAPYKGGWIAALVKKAGGGGTPSHPTTLH